MAQTIAEVMKTIDSFDPEHPLHARIAVGLVSCFVLGLCGLFLVA